jgi:hypothetical protein
MPRYPEDPEAAQVLRRRICEVINECHRIENDPRYSASAILARHIRLIAMGQIPIKKGTHE